MREQAEQYSIVLDRQVQGLERRKALPRLLPRRRARRGTWCTTGTIINVAMGCASWEMEDLRENYPQVHEVVMICMPTVYAMRR